MLLLGSRTLTVEGITVFPDHADPDQFWYLPGPVQLNRRRDGRAAFTFIKYKPAAVAAGAKGGGFLTFEVALRLAPELERRILSRLRAVARGTPRLTPAPFDEGTVQVVALDVQGAGGTAHAAAPGTFRAVEKILGTAVPSLAGDNTAAFSLTLSQEGTTILEKAFAAGTEPVGVIYDLKFTGMRPALHVEITADFKRAYTQLSASLEAQVYVVKAGIDAAFEKLRQDGVIKITVTDFTGEADQREQEQWALNFFKENLLRQWFEPTLTPGQIAGGVPQAEPLDDVRRRGNELRPPTTPAPPRPPADPPAAGPARPAAPTANTGRGEEERPGYNPTPTPPAAGASPTENTGSPAASQAPAPGAGNGSAATRGAQPAAALANSGGGTPIGVSFKLRFVRQEELKTLTLRYDRSEATQRTYAPQGFFGLLVADLARPKHFLEVDLDDPFFRVFSVSVEPPPTFEDVGLRSVHVSLDYGDEAEPETRKHADFVFDGSSAAPSHFETFLNRRFDTSYQYAVQYHFDPQSGWDGARFSYELAPERTEDRTLLLNPHDHFSFLDLTAEAVRVDWGVVDSIDVHLQHEANGARLEKVLTLTQTAAAQHWKVRTERGARDYTYRLVHRLKDGTVRETPPVVSRASLIPIDDVFPGALEIDFIPLLDPGRIRQAFIDVAYEDEPNGYHRQERLAFGADKTETVRLTLALVDPERTAFRYRVTVVGTDNSLLRGPFVETSETLVSVSAPQATP